MKDKVKLNAFVLTVIFISGLMLIFGSSFLRDHAIVSDLSPPPFNDISNFEREDIEKIDAWLNEQASLVKYPSLSVAIIRGNEMSYHTAWGYEDIQAGKKATSETVYHVASVTKVFTATLASILHAKGIVDLDESVVEYLPEDVVISTEPESGSSITLRQLISHTSGLPRGVPEQVQSVEGWYALEPQRLYGYLSEVSLVFKPGTDREYSNLGYGLLGHVLECAAEKPYDQLLQEMICEPLGLEKTEITIDDKNPAATGYGADLPRRPEKHSYRRRLAASGGLTSSASDLAQFLAAHTERGIFSEESHPWHAPLNDSNTTMRKKPLGWTERSRVSTGPILKKNGGRNNCKAWVGFAPEFEIGVVVLTNCGDPSVDDIGYWLLERSVPGGIKLVSEYGYAKVAPWSAVRWENEQPIVEVDGQWLSLISIDGIPLSRIIEFAEKEFGSKSRQRFIEDLIELLSLMGHKPQWEVTLGYGDSDGNIEFVTVKNDGRESK